MWRIFLLVLLGTSVAMLATGDRAPGRGHPPDWACGDCHLGATSTTVINPKMLVAAQEKLCASCHANAVAQSHPTGFPPGRPLPASYALDWKGDMTCSTCHAIHGPVTGATRTLRTQGGRGFCLSCHDDQFFARMRDRGASLHGLGHLAVSAPTVSVNLDPFSRQCMGCHGEKGEGGRVQVDARGLLRHGSGAVNHPVGVVYADALRRGSYRPAARLPASVVLPEGKLACVSCHVGYSQQHGALVLPVRGSALCLSCHDM